MKKIEFEYDGPFMKLEANGAGKYEILGVAVGLGKMLRDANMDLVDLDSAIYCVKKAYNDPTFNGCVLKEAPHGKFKI